jgi:hypothetical protein
VRTATLVAPRVTPSATNIVRVTVWLAPTLKVAGTGVVPFDPANNRLFVRLKTSATVVVWR